MTALPNCHRAFGLQIVDETEMARYRRRLRDWESERERQLQEFTITEKDLAQEADKKSAATSSRSKNSLKINRAPDQQDLYTAQPKEKTYKGYKVRPSELHVNVSGKALNSIWLRKLHV